MLELASEQAQLLERARIEPPEDWVDPAADVVTDEAPIETLPASTGVAPEPVTAAPGG